MDDLVLYEIRGPAAVVTLNRPDRRNALSRALVVALSAAFQRAADDSAVRAVVLAGNGPAFCAGMDLAELRETSEGRADLILGDAARLSALYEQIYELGKPTIAAVNGPAIAGGAGLVTVCDLALATPEAKFGYPEVRRGLVAAMVMPHLLRHVGERTARWLLLTGETIDGMEALRHGLINALASSEQLMATALDWCRAIAEGGPKALSATKETLRSCSRGIISPEDLARASAEPRSTEECRLGLAAFFEKQPVPWSLLGPQEVD